jgi:hypothetical protein
MGLGQGLARDRGDRNRERDADTSTKPLNEPLDQAHDPNSPEVVMHRVE